jgi:hypothetical protein
MTALPAENVHEISGPVSQVPALQSETAAVLGMIERVARDPSVDISKMTQLMAWRKEMIADQRRAAFDEAIAAAKAEIQPIERTGKGHNDKKYATLAAIAKAVDPILSQHGLSYRFRTAQGDRISVTCILSHKDGHFEETTLMGPPDASGGKNAIQAIGSTLSYLQRYSLVQMLGLAAADDDDGRAAGVSSTISALQLRELETLAAEVKADIPKFMKFFRIEEMAAMPAKDFDRAKQMLDAKRSPL